MALKLRSPGVTISTAPIRYVAPDGDDDADGSLGAPWASFERFLTAAAADPSIRTLRVREGSGPFPEAQAKLDTVTYTSGSQNQNPGSGGGFSARTIDNVDIDAYANEQPVLMRSSTANALNSTTAGIRALWRIYRCSNWSIGGGITFDCDVNWAPFKVSAGTMISLRQGSGAVWFHGGLNHVAEADVMGAFGAGYFVGWHDESVSNIAAASDLARGKGITIRRGQIRDVSIGVRIIGGIDTLIEDIPWIEGVHLWREGTGVEDHGAAAITPVFLARGTHVRRVIVGDCIDSSVQYGVDGGVFEIHGIDGSSPTTLEYMIGVGHSDGVFETGTSGWNSSTNSPNAGSLLALGGDNANITMRHCVWAGHHDSAMLYLRGCKGFTVDHCVWDRVLDSGLNNGGIVFRTPTHSSWGTGPDGLDNITIRNSIIRPRIQEHPLLNFGSDYSPSVPAGFVERNNIFSRVATSGGSGSNLVVATYPGPTTYAYNSTGLTNWRASGANRGVDTQWPVDSSSIFRDVTGDDGDPQAVLARDYRLKTGSPAIGAGHDGSDIGADVSWLT